MSQTQIYGPAGGGSIGDVTGPASSTDNAIARFDGTSGKVIQNSNVTITDNGEILGIDGTTANCAYSFAGDPNTGIFRVFADGLGLVAGGTESVRVLNGAALMNGVMRVNSGMSWHYTLTAADANLPNTQVGIVVTDTTAPRTITLPANPDDQEFHYVKDGSGGALTNNITVSGNGHNIDGAASFVINTNYGAACFTYDLTNTRWYVL